jgi:hypothetical protein
VPTTRCLCHAARHAGFIGGYHDDDAHPITFWALSHFESCGVSAEWPIGVGGEHCELFRSLRPRTVALSVLVTIEMLNALNALSQNESLLCAPRTRRTTPPRAQHAAPPAAPVSPTRP